MQRALILLLVMSAALDAAGGDSVAHPKQLVLPVRVALARYFMDGGSLACTLRDSREAHLDFLIDRSIDTENSGGNGDIYTGLLALEGKRSQLAHFDAETKKQLFTLVDDALRHQFVWDTSSHRLRPRQSDDAGSEALVSGFKEIEVRHLFRYVESRLGHPYEYLPKP